MKMAMEPPNVVFEPMRQGDIILAHPGSHGQSIHLPFEPCHLAILSQTCDVVQATKEYVLVAPVQLVSNDEFVDVCKGRKPLLIPLDDQSGKKWLADAGRAFSIPKTDLHKSQMVTHTSNGDHDRRADRTRERIARAFGRFPFPDAVHPVFKKLQDRLRSRVGGQSHLGQVINLVEALRVSANQWEHPNRELTLYLIVPGELLIPEEDTDQMWTWCADDIHGLTTRDIEANLTLDRICELILLNKPGNETTLYHLWQHFGQRLYTDLIEPALNPEVASVDVIVISDYDFSLRQFSRSESLDLETLSDTDLENSH